MQPLHWRDWVRGLVVLVAAGGLVACDDGDSDPGDGRVGDMRIDDAEVDGDRPPVDSGRDMAPADMATDGPLPDLGPDAATDAGADLGPDMAVECAEDIDCAVDSICATGRCVEGDCVVDPIPGCCTDDIDCEGGQVCDLDENVCVDAGPTPSCRYVAPLELTTFYDLPFPAYGQVYIEGLTDASAGVDPVEGLLVQAAWGPVGAEAGDPGWQFAPAEADAAWDDLAGAAPGYDQYIGEVAVAAPGEYALAFRVALAGGEWVWCDLDGSDDGFDPAQTGALTAEPGACDGDPCPALPPRCEGDVAVSTVGEGACSVTPDGPSCSFDEERVDCAALGGRCDAGGCVDLPGPPAAGEMVISEIMYDAIDPLADADAEWIELHNPTDRRFTLDGCEIFDGGDNASALGAFVVEPGAFVLLALTDDPAVNGGLDPDLLLGGGVRLGNEGEVIGLRCGATVVDTVDYGAPGFPAVAGASLSLDPEAYDAAANDRWPGWCPATAEYFNAGQPGAHRGTPGAANPACPAPVIDLCRLDAPANLRAEAGSTFVATGVVFEESLTDIDPQARAIEGLVAEAGVGPDGSDPLGNAAWSWTAAAPDPAWNAAGEDAGRDRYRATVTAPAAGEYDVAYRVSLDGGTTWVYCDLAPGSADGYQLGRAGALSVFPVGGDPCEGVVCNPVPPRCGDDGASLVLVDGPGECVTPDGQAECSYPERIIPCGAGERCRDGACYLPAPTPAVGEVVVTEIFYDATGALGDNDAEWVELYNATDRALGLDGCLLADDGGNTSPLDGVAIPPRGYALLARSADPALNGGLDVDGTFGFGLGNEGDRVEVRCGANVIDRVTYDVGGQFPPAAGYSLSLDPGATAAENDAGARWCRGVRAYFQNAGGNQHGTPGAMNPACPRVTACRLTMPLDATVEPGEPVEAAALLTIAGLTDATPGIDADVRLRNAVGYGPAGSQPSDPRWIWLPGRADAAWNNAGGADRYLGTIIVPAPGRFDVAFRFSADDGRSFTYCDRDPGSADGYQPAMAGHLVVAVPGAVCEPNPCIDPPADRCIDAMTRTVYPAEGTCSDPGDGGFGCEYMPVVEVCENGCLDGVCIGAGDPCEPNPCDRPPPAVCEGDTRVSFGAIGACRVEADEAVCDYQREEEVCPVGCAAGVCLLAEPRAPAPGELVISEIMYDPHDGLEDNTAEWFELYNTTDDPLTIEGCTFADAGASEPAAPAVVPPRTYVVFARSADPAVNGGLAPVGTFRLALNNGNDTLTLSCGDTVIDAVAYDEQGGFPPVSAFAIQVRAGALDAASNDDPASWCAARTRYLEAPAQWGSPGRANPPCDETVDFCRLQFPTDIDAEYATVESFYGRVYEEGITDLTARNDGTGLFRAQFGYGPDQSLPSQSPDWSWINAFPEPEYDGAIPPGERNNDEYRVDLVIPEPGEYDVAFRFSIDGGRSWLYCDGGDPGSSDGYRLETAGALTALPPVSPCDPNPCTTPPADACEGNVAVVYPEIGACAPDDRGLAACEYAPERIDCGADGSICVGGVCGGARGPQPGEIVITEVMYDPHGALADATAEWIEVHNVTDLPLALDGCEIADSASGVPLVGLEIAPRGYLVFANSDNPAVNGGLVDVATVFDFALTNGGDSVNLRCGGVVIDTISYDDGITFPNAQAASISLDVDRYSAAQNDDGAAWCLAVDVYHAPSGQLGTPGAPNPPCGVIDPCDPDPCPPAPAPFCEGDLAISYGPTGCEAVDGQAQCIPPEEIIEDCGDGGCVDGACSADVARAPLPGELVITEVMGDPITLDDNFAEWFEVYNLTDDAIDLDLCEARDAVNGAAIRDVVIGPGGYALFARSADPARNGGLVPDAVFNFTLTQAGDRVAILCGGIVIDEIDYRLAGFPPPTPGTAIQLDAELYDADLNDLGEAWCPAVAAYLDPPRNLGTPRRPNIPCDAAPICDGVVCADPPADFCETDTVAVAYDAGGLCDDSTGQPICEYGFEFVDCELEGRVCADGACVDAGAVPQPGDVIFTEIMYDPHFALADDGAEWFELYNRSGRELELGGCVLAVGGQPLTHVIADLTFQADDYALFANNADPARNGGLGNISGIVPFPLPNAGATLTLSCDGAQIDAVAYDNGLTFPPGRAVALNLHPGEYDAAANDLGRNWCSAQAVYFADPTGNAAQDHLGTPGAENRLCPVIDTTVDYCRFNFPVAPTVIQPQPGQVLDVYGIVYEAGITDRSVFSDIEPRLVGQAGFGPRGSNPTGNDLWQWTSALTNPGWNGQQRGEPNNDEYQASIDVGFINNGDYDLAYRFTLDDGETWTYCDLDGSPNGYSPAQAVDLTIAGDPCRNVQCFDPPPSFCEDPTTVAFYGGNGQCVVQNDQPVCQYEINFRSQCQGGQRCVVGQFGAQCQ